MPPANGSPFHHSAFRSNVPELTKPAGAVALQVNWYRPRPPAASKGTLTVAPGATIGKSKFALLGVPLRNVSALMTVVTSQSVRLWLVMEYPHPTVDPAGPATLPVPGRVLNVNGSAYAGE